MKLSRILSLLLAVLMLATAFVACDNGQTPGKTPGGDGDGTGDGTGDPGNQGSGDPIITQTNRQDYGATPFMFLTIAEQERFHKEIFVEIEDTEETIYESVYRRNEYVNEYLNIVIGTEAMANANSVAEQLVSGGDLTYDVYNLYKHGCISMATAGYTRDWTELDLNFDQPWWNGKAFDALKVNDMLLLMSGSILITEIDDTLAMVYNQRIYNEFEEAIGLDIYEAVLNNEWTLDTFISVVTKVHADLNSDGAYDVENDMLGYVAEPNSMAMNWGFAGGFACGTIKNGEYKLNMTSARVNAATTMLEKLANMFATEYADQSQQLDACVEDFINGRAFMTAIILRNLESMRGMEDDYGVIPYPKLDDKQKDYITHVGGASPIMMIPMQNVNDDARLGTILEAMCEASYRITRPAYYETALKEKGTRDEESKQALDMILASRIYDLAYISAQGSVWTIGGMVAAESTAFARQWDRQSDRLQRSLQTMVDKIIENNSY